MSIIYYRVSLHCYGIKKRCRKPDHHMFNLDNIDISIDPLDEVRVANAIDQAKTKLLQSMSKIMPDHVGRMPWIALNYCTQRKEGDWTIENWEPFSPKNKRYSLCPQEKNNG